MNTVPVGRDGHPMVKPLDFAYHDGNIYFYSAKEGEKIEDVKRDNRVCFEVDLQWSKFSFLLCKKWTAIYFRNARRKTLRKTEEIWRNREKYFYESLGEGSSASVLCKKALSLKYFLYNIISIATENSLDSQVQQVSR